MDSPCSRTGGTNSGCYEPNPVERDLDSCRFSPLPDKSGKDLGALPQAPLRKLLEKFSKNFQNFNQGGFYPYVYVVRILYVAIYKLRIPAAPRPIPSTELARRQLVALSHLRYRIEVVGMLQLNGTERPMCRSASVAKYLLTSQYRRYVGAGRRNLGSA